VPVWHEFTKRYREEGLIEVVAIATEQHPQRTRLFAQWKEFDFPILWDPFNLTGSDAVPKHIFVDEFGIVRHTRLSTQDFEEEFLFKDYPEPDAEPDTAKDLGAGLVQLGKFAEGTFEHDHYQALSNILWGGTPTLDEGIEILEAQVSERPEDAALHFRAGVARRMRYDSELTRPEDFQSAVNHWESALTLVPGQYIWRRRIQQYGPRMDKPYNFYSWVEQAQKDIAMRGEEPHPLAVSLTPAELAEEATFQESSGHVEPKAAGLPRDEEGFVQIETAVAFGTTGNEPVASVHLALRPNPAKEAHWNHEAGALQVWVTPPAEWKVDRRLLEHAPRSDVATSEELRNLSFEVRLPSGVSEGVLEAYALYFVCEGVDGVCMFLRQDFEIPVKKRE
jgi:hypothetical protein